MKVWLNVLQPNKFKLYNRIKMMCNSNDSTIIIEKIKKTLIL